MTENMVTKYIIKGKSRCKLTWCITMHFLPPLDFVVALLREILFQESVDLSAVNLGL